MTLLHSPFRTTHLVSRTALCHSRSIEQTVCLRSDWLELSDGWQRAYESTAVELMYHILYLGGNSLGQIGHSLPLRWYLDILVHRLKNLSRSL